jgi:hypothetical protein
MRRRSSVAVTTKSLRLFSPTPADEATVVFRAALAASLTSAEALREIDISTDAVSTVVGGTVGECVSVGGCVGRPVGTCEGCVVGRGVGS